jgi:hypothetical protein
MLHGAVSLFLVSLLPERFMIWEMFCTHTNTLIPAVDTKQPGFLLNESLVSASHASIFDVKVIEDRLKWFSSEPKTNP